MAAHFLGEQEQEEGQEEGQEETYANFEGTCRLFLHSPYRISAMAHFLMQNRSITAPFCPAIEKRRNKPIQLARLLAPGALVAGPHPWPNQRPMVRALT